MVWTSVTGPTGTLGSEVVKQQQDKKLEQYFYD